MKLFLTSAGLKNEKVKAEFIKLFAKPFAQIRAIMFSLVGNKEQEFYVDESIQELLDLGIKKENLQLFNLVEDKKCEDLNNFDLVYICGGNTFHYLDRLRKLGCFDKIKDFVNKGGLYFGVSAGSVIAGPNINISSPWDENDIGITDFAGLNFIDFAICPHYESKDDEIIKQRQKDLNIPVRLLKDDQVFIVLDNEIKLVGEGEERKL
ncbi:MAG: Type 1 glutamine amidotransferase-like domain-containing protein [Candidatus Parcubacteria bacterium]|nr:Type 1 glutamine amidotransferase-like domain-containing protein [Candidatus Parcubacteria bacterium]